jgi:hypothetical protein
LLIVGIAMAIVGLAVTIGAGGALLWAAASDGSDGYLTTPAYELSTEGHAVISEAADLHAAPDEWIPWIGGIDARLTVTAEGDQPAFVGIGPSRDVAAYLAGVPHAEVIDLGPGARDVGYRLAAGPATPEPPAAQDFWVVSAEGSGVQSLTWEPSRGRWTAVLMNADGSAGVSAALSGGVPGRLLWPIGVGLLLGGVVLLALAAGVIIVATAGRRVHPQRTDGQPVPPTPVGHGAYPLVIEGYLDEPLNRALWLVKWLLAIPHYVVLFFLWVAFYLLTLAAGVAILFTGRYPRGIFDFNVGVLRWTWRVAYYSHGALGTDRYPPFALAPVDHPATLDVAYPERLSRGLVLVKWWLLAIPHYLVLAVIVGGATSWSLGDRAGDNWQFATSGGLLSILVLIAGVTLLVTSRYPRGLFDLIMGLNRWFYRVIAYAALMTDQYPPFRLDTGGSEPPRGPTPPAGPTGAGDADREELIPG